MKELKFKFKLLNSDESKTIASIRINEKDFKVGKVFSVVQLNPLHHALHCLAMDLFPNEQWTYSLMI
jgi:hypothetical protein